MESQNKRDPNKHYKMVTGKNGKGVYVELNRKELDEFKNRKKADEPIKQETELEKLIKRVAELEDRLNQSKS